MTELASLQATVYGRVQGVFFRVFVSKHARELGLTGYVRNRPDGSVAIWAEGTKSELERLLSHLGEGPPAASVKEVAASWSAYTGKYRDFEVRH